MTPQESLSFSRHKTTADIAAGEKVCPVCSREVKYEFVPLVAMSDELRATDPRQRARHARI